jgi:hypothetical protein
MEQSGLAVGIKVKEIATRDSVWQDCTVQHSDGIGLVFEVNRTVADAGGVVETVVAQILVPWQNVKHIVVMEQPA